MPWRDSSLRIAQVSHWMLLRTVGRCQDGGSEPVLGSDYDLRPDGRTGGSSSCIHHSTTGVLRRPRTSLKCVASTRGCGPFSAVVRIFSGYDHRLGQKNPPEDCGCGTSPTKVSAGLVVRNTILALALLPTLILSHPPEDNKNLALSCLVVTLIVTASFLRYRKLIETK